MSDDLTAPPIEAFDAYDWQAVAARADKLAYSELFADEFFAEAKRLEDANDERGRDVFRFLGNVAHMRLEPTDRSSPLGPATVFYAGRTVGLGDFPDSIFAALRQLIDRCALPSLKARFADMVHIATGDHAMAAVAAESYLTAFQTNETADRWVGGIRMLERGMALARILGAEKPLFVRYVSFIEQKVAELTSTCTDAYTLRLLDLQIEYRVGDATCAATAAEAIGDRLDILGSSHLAQGHLGAAVKLRTRAKDPEGARRARLKKGESLIRQAEAAFHRESGGNLGGAHFLALGIECLRKAKAAPERIAELHKRLLETQEKARGEMQAFSHEVDLSDSAESARKHVRGRSLPDALLVFALGHPVLQPEELKRRVLKFMQQFPISSLIGASLVSNDGRVIARKPSTFGAKGTDLDAAVMMEVFSQARTVDWGLRAAGYIQPCRHEIWIEHRPTMRDLAFLVQNSPVIPPGHEDLFLRGIHAGFEGDLVVCAHVLVPQIEELIRYLLKRNGHVTSKLDAKLIQEERLLGNLLSMPETAEIMGADHVFELRGLLCEKFGFDLRNRLAHGFVTTDACWGVDVANLWWLVLRLLCFPLAQALKADSPPDDSAEAEQNESSGPAPEEGEPS